HGPLLYPRALMGPSTWGSAGLALHLSSSTGDRDYVNLIHKARNLHHERAQGQDRFCVPRGPFPPGARWQAGPAGTPYRCRRPAAPVGAPTGEGRSVTGPDGPDDPCASAGSAEGVTGARTSTDLSATPFRSAHASTAASAWPFAAASPA